MLQRGMKRLDFSGQGRMKEILLGGALAVVVIAALVLSIIHMVKGPTPPKVTYHFQCLKCSHEFEVVDTDVPQDVWDRTRPGERPILDCPNPDCEEKLSAKTMEWCPACEQWYLPDEEATGPRVCTKCGADIAQWVVKNLKR